MDHLCILYISFQIDVRVDKYSFSTLNTKKQQEYDKRVTKVLFQSYASDINFINVAV